MDINSPRSTPRDPALFIAAIGGVLLVVILAWLAFGPFRSKIASWIKPAVPAATTPVHTNTPTTPDSAVLGDATSTPTIDLKSTTDQIFTLGVPTQVFENDRVAYIDPKTSQGVFVAVGAFSDSRCPADVQCIWAGEQGVSLQVTNLQTGEKSSIELKTTTATKITAVGFIFQLLEIEDGKGGSYAQIQVTHS